MILEYRSAQSIETNSAGRKSMLLSIEVGIAGRRWRCGTSGSCHNEVTALVVQGYCIDTGPMSCLLLSGQGTIILETIEN